MFRRKLTHWEVETYLRIPIRKWIVMPSINPPLKSALVKSSLQVLLLRAQRLFPKTVVTRINVYDRPLHDCSSNYLWHLITLEKHLSNERWFDACDLLVDMLHYYHVEDRRILGTLISILEKYLQ